MPKQPRTILHLDLDAFFCAVEEQHDPTLRGIAFAVGGSPTGRGVVASCSYPARHFGIRSAMPMSQAVRLCPDLKIVSSHFADYTAASRKVMALLGEYTPMIEQISIDEAFLDVTGIPTAGEPLARELQNRIADDLGLPCSLGVASNKHVAKMATNVGKDTARAYTDGPPNAITVIPVGGEAEFLAPLPIRDLWGVGPKTAARMQQLGIETIGDLAQYTDEVLTRLFGKYGADLGARARGEDDRPVETEHDTKSISHETTFERDISNKAQLHDTLKSLASSVGFRLRRDGLHGTTVKLKLRWSNFTTFTRQTTLPHPIDQDDDICNAALLLFEEAWLPGKPVRLMGVGVSSLSEVATTVQQANLWEDPADQKSRALQATVDELRLRFGSNVIQRGNRRIYRDEH